MRKLMIAPSVGCCDLFHVEEQDNFHCLVEIAFSFSQRVFAIHHIINREWTRNEVGVYG